MGIDRIGTPSSPPPSLDSATAALESASEASEASKASEASSSLGNASALAPGDIASGRSQESSSILNRLERGEVTRDQYVDFRVDEAVSPFASRLNDSQLSQMRAVLRERLESDPTVVELLRRATANAASSK